MTGRKRGPVQRGDGGGPAGAHRQEVARAGLGKLISFMTATWGERGSRCLSRREVMYVRVRALCMRVCTTCGTQACHAVCGACQQRSSGCEWSLTQSSG
jgi:hypothetical protein